MQLVGSLKSSNIRAVLGPTNTGKTYYAMERMLGHSSGIIGFPLRLLARENYERAVAVKDESKVALVTGEEKIIPPGARYFLCTVEAMPMDKPVDFMAIDEIQMCADPDRGHIFTDRLFHARGSYETIFLGAEAMRPILKRLIPGVEFSTRPRLSKLSYTGQTKVNRLSPRSAVVAFTASNVYSLAELIRRQRGGAAVVLGALSPRTRNAQVEMYQNGEVDYLVATDAIGMGLNMDVQHVAFSSTRKFDGKRFRQLNPAELAQTAGRAGRFTEDGTFGTTASIGDLDLDVIERIENHEFDFHRQLFWRNPNLVTNTLTALKNSLRVSSNVEGLVRVREADDERALNELSRDAEIADYASNPTEVQTLWDVCQIPDFEKEWTIGHARMLERVLSHLKSGDGQLPEDWIAENISHIDRIDGEIDSLSNRIARIRTWTYISNKNDWLADPLHWQLKTREIEDRLSDALHERLTQRFVDKRTALLMSKMQNQKDLIAAVRADGDVLIEGHYVGHLKGLKFMADEGQFSADRQAVSGAASKVLREAIHSRIQGLLQSDVKTFVWGEDSLIYWEEEAVAKVAKGNDALRPVVQVLHNDLLDTQDRDALCRHLQEWAQAQIKEALSALYAALDSDVSGAARGVVFQLGEHLGSMVRDEVQAQISVLEREDRTKLKKLGVRIGRSTVYMSALLKPRAVDMRARLWNIWHQPPQPFLAPPAGRASIELEKTGSLKQQSTFLSAIGYQVFTEPNGAFAVRLDMVERIAEQAWTLGLKNPFPMDEALMALAGAGVDRTTIILHGLGFRSSEKDDVRTFRVPLPAHLQKSKKKPTKPAKSTKQAAKQVPPKERPVKVDPDSPFAILQQLRKTS